jgi:NADH dehydrogenase I D subunit
MVLNLGPQHPATHGTLRLTLELEAERIVRCVPDIGYLHTGFEKLGEHHTYNQWVTVTDRMNYLSPLSNNIGYAMTVEKLMGLEVPPRAMAIRVILAELSRIADHLVWLGTHALDIGAFTAFLYTFEQRERLYNIFEATTGARLTTSYTRVGGLGWDVPDDFTEMVQDFEGQFTQSLDEVDRLLTRNRIWMDRTKDIGVVSAQEAIAWNMTGPVLRGSGVDFDLRKTEPYCGYEDYDFEVPVGANGDVYDRYLVRMEEMLQSLHIVEQAVKGLPDGPVKVDDSKVILPEKDDVYSGMESLIHHFKVTMDGHGLTPPLGEVYVATEAPNGELGFYIVSDGSDCAYRMRVRPPSLMNYQAFPEMVKGLMIADVVAVLGSLNVIAGELDR